LKAASPNEFGYNYSAKFALYFLFTELAGGLLTCCK